MRPSTDGCEKRESMWATEYAQGLYINGPACACILDSWDVIGYPADSCAVVLDGRAGERD